MKGNKDGGAVASNLLGGERLTVEYLLDVNGIFGSVIRND